MEPKDLEQELAQSLTEGELEKQDTGEAARRQLPVRTEIRIQAKIDPIVEETRKYRSMAKEIDQRYDRYKE